MKILLGLLITLYSHVVLAGCPAKEFVAFTYMTKEELIESYCFNRSSVKEDQERFHEFRKLAEESIAAGALDVAKINADNVNRYAKEIGCSMDNYTNAFRVLRKDHGVEKEEDIKCE